VIFLHFKIIFKLSKIIYNQLLHTERRGEEDRAKNSWMTSKSGVERKFAYSARRCRIAACGEWWCTRHEHLRAL